MKSPKHVAIIMDGNGRWANARRKNRFWGHLKGSEVAQSIVEHCSQKTDVEFLTLYAFSTENWSRPQEEVNFLFKLLERHLRKKQAYLISNNVKLKVIGELSALPKDLQSSIKELVLKTSDNTGLNLVLALNYGGRQEIISNINKYFNKNIAPLTEESLNDLMNHQGTLPAPDLIIRTSGEQRLSNFMLWQSAYSEFYFTDVLWPDFKPQNFDEALNEFNLRNRRFGKAQNTPNSEASL